MRLALSWHTLDAIRERGKKQARAAEKDPNHHGWATGRQESQDARPWRMCPDGSLAGSTRSRSVVGCTSTWSDKPVCRRKR